MELWCFLCWQPQHNGKTIELVGIWNAIKSMWRDCKAPWIVYFKCPSRTRFNQCAWEKALSKGQRCDTFVFFLTSEEFANKPSRSLISRRNCELISDSMKYGPSVSPSLSAKAYIFAKFRQLYCNDMACAKFSLWLHQSFYNNVNDLVESGIPSKKCRWSKHRIYLLNTPANTWKSKTCTSIYI